MKRKFHHHVTMTYHSLPFWANAWLLLLDPAYRLLHLEFDSLIRVILHGDDTISG
jgi:hypothetical protein